MKIQKGLIYFLGLVISSCATFSGSHPDKVNNAKKAIENNRSSRVVEKKFLNSFGANGVNASLGSLEIGRFEQLIGNTKLSQNEYDKATNYVAKSEAEAKIRVRNILKNTQATLLSDKERYYYIPDYEVTFLYAYQALNYLLKHDLENAAVSIRNLSYAQYATYQTKDLVKDVRNSNYNEFRHVNPGEISSKLSSSKEFRQLSGIADKVENSYENAFGYYLEAIIYQAYDDNLNNANLSMSNALKVVPNNPYVKKDFKEINKAFYNGGSVYKHNQGKLVVIYEDGWVEPIKRFDLPIVIFFQTTGIQKLSLPYYANYYLPTDTQVRVFKGEEQIDSGKTSVLVDTTAMAAKSLSDQYPAIVTREILRLVTKTAISAAAIQSSGDYAALAAIGASVYSLATTKADQRSWNLLPKSVSLFSTNLEKGTYTLKIDNKIKSIIIKPQKTTLVWVVKENNFEKFIFNDLLS